MMPTFSERQKLAKQFATDITRMQHCLHTAGRHVSDDNVVYAWAEYSDHVCASWLTLPDDEAALLETLLKYLPSGAGTQAIMWRTTCLYAGDGSGDSIVELPDELLAQLGWKVGDTLTISKTDSGELILRRAD